MKSSPAIQAAIDLTAGAAGNSRGKPIICASGPCYKWDPVKGC